jgi:hypothetical protein
MNIHTFKNTLTLATISGLVLFALTRVTAGFLPLMPVMVSYTAVVILAALAAMDYRIGSKTSIMR